MVIISIGEILWDVIGSTEHLGGAPFNFAAHAAKLGHELRFVSAVGADARGARALSAMREMNLTTRYIAHIPNQPTGYVTVSVDDPGQPAYVIHRPAAYESPQLSEEDFAALLSPSPDWIYFGTLAQMSLPVRSLTMRVIHSNPNASRFYDVNLRADSYNPSLVRELMSRASVVKVNAAEAVEVARLFGEPPSSLKSFCSRYAEKFQWRAVCVTRGRQGCVLFMNGNYIESKGYAVQVADAVGAGDAFAAALLHGMGENWTPERIADFANRIGAVVAGRSGAIPAWTPADVSALANS
jgi:fructokinase